MYSLQLQVFGEREKKKRESKLLPAKKSRAALSTGTTAAFSIPQIYECILMLCVGALIPISEL